MTEEIYDQEAERCFERNREQGFRPPGRCPRFQPKSATLEGNKIISGRKWPLQKPLSPLPHDSAPVALKIYDPTDILTPNIEIFDCKGLMTHVKPLDKHGKEIKLAPKQKRILRSLMA